MLDKKYSKTTFGVSWPFCAEAGKIRNTTPSRYWKKTYQVKGKSVRVTSQWYEHYRENFERYLKSKGITHALESVIRSTSTLSSRSSPSSEKYATIKELVIEAYFSENRMPAYESLTALVKKHFPNSRWKKTHYSWYKTKIKQGKISVNKRDDEDELVPVNEIEIENEIEESIETWVSLERDLHGYLGRRLEKIEIGLKLYPKGIEFNTDAGRIDILAIDKNGGLVVIETKAGQAKDAALGQLLGYIGSLAKMRLTSKNIRGILVAADFESRVIHASSGLTNIQLFKYKMDFEFGEIQ